MASYVNQSDLRRIAANTPEEAAQNIETETAFQGDNVAALRTEIARTRDPKARAVLMGELAQVSGGNPVATGGDYSDFDAQYFGGPKNGAKRLDYDKFDEAYFSRQATTSAAGATQAKPGFVSSLAQGGKIAFEQLPQLGYGLAAIGAAGLESMVGTGGLATALKNGAVSKYEEWGKKIAADSTENYEWDKAYDKAKAGDIGALVDFLGYGIGYGLGQGAQLLATAGIGGAVAKTVGREAVEKLASNLVAKEAAKLAAGKEVTDTITKQAVANVAGRIGVNAAVGASAVGMEGGEIGGDLAERSVKEGRALTGSELVKALGATTLAAGFEFAGDKLGLGALTGKLSVGREMTGLTGRAVRGATGAAAAAPGEFSTEYMQTGAEEYGKGNEVNILPWNQSEEAQRQAINAGALGAVGGGAHGTLGGLASSPKKPTIADIGKAGSVDEAIAASNDVLSQPPALGYQAGPPMVVFPDGTTMTRSEAEQHFSAEELQRLDSMVQNNPLPEMMARAQEQAAELDRAARIKAERVRLEEMRQRALAQQAALNEEEGTLTQAAPAPVAPVEKAIMPEPPSEARKLADQARAEESIQKELSGPLLEASVRAERIRAERARLGLPPEPVRALPAPDTTLYAGSDGVGTVAQRKAAEEKARRVREERIRLGLTPDIERVQERHTARVAQQEAYIRGKPVSEYADAELERLSRNIGVPKSLRQVAAAELQTRQESSNVTSQMDESGNQGQRAVGAGGRGDAQALPGVERGGGVDARAPMASGGSAEIVGNAGSGRGAVNAAESAQVASQEAPPASQKGKASRLKPLTDDRIAGHADTLRSMAPDAGWAEEGGRLLRDNQGNANARTQWIPRAEWFMAGMVGDPKSLQDAVERAIAGQPMTAKEKRTVQGMMDFIDHMNGGPVNEEAVAESDALEEIGYDEMTASKQSVIDAWSDFDFDAPGAAQDDAAAMRALGFTEDEINEYTRRESSGTEGRSGQAEAGSVEGAQGTVPEGPASGASQGEGQGFNLEGQTPAEVKAQEQQRQADERKPEDKESAPNVTADQVDLFNTQGGLFNSNRDQSTQAESILDAAGITGKERLEALKDVKAGAITVGELERAHPAKQAAEAQAEPVAQNELAAEASEPAADEGKPDTALFSRSEASPETHTLDSLRASLEGALDGLRKGLGKAITTSPQVRIITDAEIPDSIIGSREAYERDGKVLAYVDPKDGTIHFVADNIPTAWSERDLVGLVKHELAVHALHLGRDSTEFEAILRDLELMRKAGNKEVKAAFKRVPDSTPAENRAEEALGYLVQSNPELGIVQRFVAWLRAGIRALGKAMPVIQRAKFFEWAAKLTPNDLHAMAKAALIRAPEQMAAGPMEQGSAVFSMDRTIDDIARAFEKRIGEALSGGRVTGPILVAENTPASMQVFGWADRKVVINLKELQKIAAKPGFETDRAIASIVHDLRRPALMFWNTKNQSLNFLRPGKTNMMIGVAPDAETARGTEHLVLTAHFLTGGAGQSLIDKIERGELVLIYKGKDVPGISGLAEKKMPQYSRDLAHELLHARDAVSNETVAPGLANARTRGNGANFSIVREPDLVKWEQSNWGGKPLFSRQATIGESKRNGGYTQEQKDFFARTGRTIEVPTLQEKIKALWQDAGKKLAQGLVDQFQPLRELGGKAYTLARLSKGSAGAFEAMLHHGKLALKDGAYDADTTGGVVERLGIPLHGEMEDFLWWVAANRAERLAAEDREHLFTPADIAAGKSLDNGATDFDYTLQHGPRAGQATRDRTLIYRDALKTFDEFNRNAMDMAEQSGLIDGAARQYWEHEFYVPFYRVSDEDGEFVGAKMGNALVRQQAFKQLKGGSDKLNSDLLANTLRNWAHLIDAAAKNRAAKASLEAAEQMGVAHKATPGEKKTVWFMDNGQKQEYKVEDPYVMTAITSLEYAGMRGPLMDVLSTFKHWLTIGVTASPAFKVRNLIRDSLQAIGTSDLSYNPVRNIAEGWKATDRASQDYVSALASGGLIRFGTMLEGKESDRVRQLVKSGVKDSTILDNEGKVRAFYDRYLEPAIAAYNELGNRGEEINRAALFKQLIAQGVDHAEASLMARDLMDFSMQGSWNTIRFLTQVVPFMNARLQGLYKLGRAAKEDPAKFATVLGATALFSISLMLAYSDDDDWKKREDFDRDNFWWFKFGGTAFRVPKPFEIGALATLAERSVELITSDEMTGKRFGERVKALLSDNLSMNPVPQAIKPLIDLYSNKDSFTGRPIETMGMERLEPEYRYASHTSMVARGLSTATMGAFSPVQYDHLIRSYFSWLGAFAVGTADMVIRGVSDEPSAPTLDYWKLATQGFVRELPEPGSRYVSQMYDQAKVLEQAYGTYRDLIKRGKVEEAKEYAEENRDKLERYRSVESVKKAEAKMNERIRIIERSNIDPDEKKAIISAIQQQKDQIARRVAPGYSAN